MAKPPDNASSWTPEMFATRDRFFFPLDQAAFTAPILESAFERSAAMVTEAEVFIGNLTTAMLAGAIPYYLVHESVTRRRWQQVHIAERIRHTTDTPDRGVDEATALEVARRRFKEESATQEAQDHLARSVLSELADHLRDDAFSDAAIALLRQMTSSIWVACELLIKALYERATSIPCEIGVRKALEYILPEDGDGESILRRWQLWILFQRRHVFVHNGGRADPAYLLHTGAPLQLGDQVTATPKEIANYLNATRAFGIYLIQNAPE